MRRIGFLAALPLLISTLLSWSVLTAPSASAYGRAAQWQIGLSFNCNNPAICGSQLGGFWGWAEFDSDNTADAQLTDCEHLQGGRAGGAHHFSADVHSWTIAPGSAGPMTFFVTSETDTITGRTGGPPVVIDIPSEYMDTGIPAVAGHYSSRTLFGMQAPPGANFEFQVVQLRG
jgi:hypothetical protein